MTSSTLLALVRLILIVIFLGCIAITIWLLTREWLSTPWLCSRVLISSAALFTIGSGLAVLLLGNSPRGRAVIAVLVAVAAVLVVQVVSLHMRSAGGIMQAAGFRDTFADGRVAVGFPCKVFHFDLSMLGAGPGVSVRALLCNLAIGMLIVCVPLALARRLQHEHAASRRSRNVCVGCGYDLRGSQSGVCPECGAEA